MKKGDIIKFGEFEWQVLEKRQNSALLITQNIIELRAFHNKQGDVNWSESQIRKYLNNEFFEKFSIHEKSKILDTHVVNAPNVWFETSSGENTIDKVFLLSIEEVVSLYFGDSSALLSIPNGKYKYWFNRKDANNEKRRATYLNCAWWWWLRTSGRKQAKVAYVHGDGNIGVQGNNAYKCNIKSVFHPINNDTKGGLRPALWISIASE